MGWVYVLIFVVGTLSFGAQVTAVKTAMKKALRTLKESAGSAGASAQQPKAKPPASRWTPPKEAARKEGGGGNDIYEL